MEVVTRTHAEIWQKSEEQRMSREQAKIGIIQLLHAIGEDPSRDGLKDTPARVVKAFSEMCSGYTENPGLILERQFEVSHDEMIVLRGIEFVSLCEHHMLPFLGHATVGYIPADKGKVVGLSKLARLVLCYAKRLQVQERLTNEIADALDKHLSPDGCGVIITATHSCMSCRGVKQPNAEMITSSMRGAFRNNSSTRSEFLSFNK